MKNLYTLLFALVAINSAMAQWTSNCDVNEELLIYYEEDVKDMAAQWLFDIHSPDTVLIDIPQWSLDTIWAGLAAINNRCDLPEVDSVFNKYCVHIQQGFVNIKYILVQLDSNCSWLNNWMNLQTNTGVADLDSLFSQYEFTLVDFFSWPSGNYGYLETTEMINLYAFCDSIVNFDGITSAEPDSWTGNCAWYDHIYFNDTSGVRYYTFQIGVGLGGRYRWNFKVNTDCSIEFLGNQGSGYYYYNFPEPINCNIFTSETENKVPERNFLLFPNPANDKITISSLTITGNIQLSIFYVSGEKVMERKLTDNETQIDISTLTRGVYIVKLQNEKILETGKMIKE